jgi:hypothetical protein
MNAKRSDRGVGCDGFHQVAKRSGRNREGVASRKDYFPYVAVGVEPVADFAGHVGYILEWVVLAKTEPATDTAGGSRDNQGSPVVFLDNAVGLACRQVSYGVVNESGNVFPFYGKGQNLAKECFGVARFFYLVGEVP